MSRLLWAFLGLLAFTAIVHGGVITFTGHSATDFDPSNEMWSTRQLAGRFVFDRTSKLDASCSQWMKDKNRRSGVDLDAIYVVYDDVADILYGGLECAGICGDTDGDGKPGSIDQDAINANVNLGSDAANMCGEMIALAGWTGVPESYSVDYIHPYYYFPNWMLGTTGAPTSCLYKPASADKQGWDAYEIKQSAATTCPYVAGRDHSLTEAQYKTTYPECVDLVNMVNSPNLAFGSQKLYNKAGGPPRVNIQDKALNVNATYPHIQWYQADFSKYPGFNFKRNFTQPGDSFFRFALSANTKATDSCGEDSVSADIMTIKWDCFNYPNGNATLDECGVCGGNNTECADCFGVPNGDAEYDLCNVCNGTNDCLDCFNTPFGTSVVDECGVCNGTNACWDCFAVPFGAAEYDQCGVCNGTNECWDCFDTPFGTSVVDECGVCNGTNACWDCFAVPFGTAEYDTCGVCGGIDECYDCFGTQWGEYEYDLYGVCNGTNWTDCSGNPWGNLDYDACGVCGGDESCRDCFGVLFGPAVYDFYGICNNMNWTDCSGDPHGDLEYDDCGVCGGDGESCKCHQYLGYKEPELCYALLRWSIAASRVKITDTLDVLYAIKHELPYYDFKSSKLELAQYIDNVHHFCDECLDNFDYAQIWFADRLAGNCIGTNCEELAVDRFEWSL